MSGDEMDLDTMIADLEKDARWYVRELRVRHAMLDYLKELRDGMPPRQRQEVRELEDLYRRPHKQDRHRRPARPAAFGGGSDG